MTVSEARAALPEVLTRVAQGEEITITRYGSPIAVVVRPDIIWSRPGTEAVMEETEGLLRILRERAKRHGRSLEQELRAILDAAKNAPGPARYRRSALPPCAQPGADVVAGGDLWRRGSLT